MTPWQQQDASKTLHAPKMTRTISSRNSHADRVQLCGSLGVGLHMDTKEEEEEEEEDTATA